MEPNCCCCCACSSGCCPNPKAVPVCRVKGVLRDVDDFEQTEDFAGVGSKSTNYVKQYTMNIKFISSCLLPCGCPKAIVELDEQQLEVMDDMDASLNNMNI